MANDQKHLLLIASSTPPWPRFKSDATATERRVRICKRSRQRLR